MVASILPAAITGAEVAKRGRRIIGPIDLALGPTGVTIVMGPNGAGKTTLLRALHGLERLSAGTIDWQRPVVEVQTRQAFVFQSPVVLRRTVIDNVAYPLRVRGLSRQAARDQAEDWVARIGLGTARARDAAVLSGGERQKLALARALITEPELLFLDEPTTNLDGRAMREIEAILIEAASSGTRIIMTTHNIGQARRLATEIVFLYRGKQHEVRAADAFFAAPETPEAAAFIRGDIVE